MTLGFFAILCLPLSCRLHSAYTGSPALARLAALPIGRYSHVFQVLPPGMSAHSGSLLNERVSLARCAGPAAVVFQTAAGIRKQRFDIS